MAALTKLEIALFRKLFIRDGYVLNLSTNDFNALTMQCVGIALCEHYRDSKGKSLTAYMDSASDEDRLKLIIELFAYYEANYKSEFDENAGSDESSNCPPYNNEYSQQYHKCKEIMRRITTSEAPMAPVAENLIGKFSSEYMTQQINLMRDMQEKNPTEAIGKAKELIESCCKTILEKTGVGYDDNWNVNKLASETMKQLKIAPKSILDTTAEAKTIKAMLGNLLQVTTRIAELRNQYGGGHGKSASYKGLDPRHAKLAVNASITFVTFLWETHERQGES